MKKAFKFFSNLTKRKGIWYTIYYLSIGFVLRVLRRAWLGVKSLGWLFGFIAFAISSTIFFSPTIASTIAFYITGNRWFLGIATGYFTWVMLPTGSSLVYAFVVAGTIPVVKFFKDSIEGKKNEKTNTLLQDKNKPADNA
jgi:hypothetical protein